MTEKKTKAAVVAPAQAQAVCAWCAKVKQDGDTGWIKIHRREESKDAKGHVTMVSVITHFCSKLHDKLYSERLHKQIMAQRAKKAGFKVSKQQLGGE